MKPRGPFPPMNRTGLIVRLLITVIAVVYIYRLISSTAGTPFHR